MIAPGRGIDAGFPSSEIIVAPSDHYGLALQGDGKVVVGGTFVVDAVYWEGVARLLPDGRPDRGFARVEVEIDDGVIYAVTVQHDGKILVGGSFSTVNGAAHKALVRLHADGRVDEGFDPDLGDAPFREVWVIEIDAFGRILVGGHLHDCPPVVRSNLVRLLDDGSADPQWQGRICPAIRSVFLRNDNRMVVGGDDGIYGLSSNGATLSTLYSVSSCCGDDRQVSSVFEQPDEKILFTVDRETPALAGYRPKGRRHPDGTQDMSYSFVYSTHETYMVTALHSDGWILFGSVHRYSVDETLYVNITDPFGAGVAGLSGDGDLRHCLIQPDGRILVAGHFSALGGTTKYNLGRWDPGLGPHRGRPINLSFDRTGRLRFTTQRGLGYALRSTDDVAAWPDPAARSIHGTGNPLETLLEMTGARRFFRVDAVRDRPDSPTAGPQSFALTPGNP